MPDKDVAKRFDGFFEIVPAMTEPLLEEAFRLRYRVFCLETGLEPPENHLGGMERDEFDSNAGSTHCLVRHRPSGAWAATARLVLPDPDSGWLFPVERHGHVDGRAAGVLKGIDRGRLAEVSRLCVDGGFKRRKGESGTVDGIPLISVPFDEDDDRRRHFPPIILGLLGGLVRMSRKNGVDHWYFTAGPGMAKALADIGIRLVPAGPPSGLRGNPLTPYLVGVQALLDGVSEKTPRIWRFLSRFGEHL